MRKAGSELRLIRRHTRLLAAAAMAFAMVGAFLAWGPIGLGNGPLWLPTASSGTYSSGQQRPGPVAYVLPIGNHGHGALVIDSVGAVYRHGTTPILLKALVGHMTGYACTALGTVSGAQSAVAACVESDLRVAAGASIRAGTYPTSGSIRKHQSALVLELTGPGPGQCWDLVSVVVRYHIGIRHYAATFPQGNVITCRARGKGGSTSRL